MAVTIRLLTNADVGPVSRLMAQALANDSFFRWLCKPTQVSAELLLPWMTVSVVRGIQRGHTYGAYQDQTIVGAAIWSPPGVSITSEYELLLQTSILDAQLEVMPAYAMLSEISSLPPSEPHFYLRDIVVSPSFRNQGVGRQLLQRVHSTCDADSWYSYLETTSKQAANFFTRLGYVASGSVVIDETLTFTGMKRAPQR